MIDANVTSTDHGGHLATRARILDAAEELLGEHGMAGTSIRMITDKAQVNVAAVNYHFGGKEKLVRAVIDRRIADVDVVRAARLDELDARAAREHRQPTVTELIEALLGPLFDQALDAKSGWPHFIRFVSRLVHEPGAEELAPPPEALRIFHRFEEALMRAAPHLANDETARRWRLIFMRGATQNTLLMLTAIKLGGMPKGDPFIGLPVDIEAIKRELVVFVSAALSAPLARK